MFIELIVPVTDFESLPLNSDGLRAFSDSLWEGVRSALHDYDQGVYNARARRQLCLLSAETALYAKSE